MHIPSSSVALLASCFLLILLATGCKVVDDDDEMEEVKEYVRVGDRLPPFTVQTVMGDGTPGTFSTARLTGQTVIVFFHTACSDCQRELPRLNDYYQRHCDEQGFQMVAISREEEAESIAAFWQEQGLTLPYSPQPDRSIYSLFASSVIPRVYVCTAQGVVTQVYIEQLPPDF